MTAAEKLDRAIKKRNRYNRRSSRCKRESGENI